MNAEKHTPNPPSHPGEGIDRRKMFVRLWSLEPFKGSVPDGVRGGYTESDAQFRARISAAIAKATGD